jgi:hypothetical protein
MQRKILPTSIAIQGTTVCQTVSFLTFTVSKRITYKDPEYHCGFVTIDSGNGTNVSRKN